MGYATRVCRIFARKTVFSTAAIFLYAMLVLLVVSYGIGVLISGNPCTAVGLHGTAHWIHQEQSLLFGLAVLSRVLEGAVTIFGVGAVAAVFLDFILPLYRESCREARNTD